MSVFAISETQFRHVSIKCWISWRDI